jgi:hypothetical protein
MLSTAKGGSHLLTHTVYRALIHYGGEVFQSCPVDKIIVENGAAKGVAVRTLRVSQPKSHGEQGGHQRPDGVPTFLWLVGEEHLSPEVAMAVKNFDYESQVLFTNYYFLNEPLRFNAFDWTNKHVDPSSGTHVETERDTARCNVHSWRVAGPPRVQRLFPPHVARSDPASRDAHALI